MTNYTPPDPVTKRVRFFDGQFLQDQDFIDEQNYHLDRQRRAPRGLGVTGVVAGLEVTTSAQYEMTIAPGEAIDSLGRSIVLGQPLVLTFPPDVSGSFPVVLLYRDVQTDIATTGGESATRWNESPMAGATLPGGTAVVAPADAPVTWSGPVVPLGTWAWAGDKFVPAGDAAPPVGLQVPGALGGATLQVGTATRPGLTVDALGQVGVGTTTPENAENWDRALDVIGPNSSKLSVRTSAIDSRVMAHDDGLYGAPPGQIIGTATDHPVTVITSNTARLVVTDQGHLGIGTMSPENSEGWSRVVDVQGDYNAKLAIRSPVIDSRVMAHDDGLYGAPPGQIIGTYSAHPLTLITNKAARLTVTDAAVLIGTTAPDTSETWNQVFDVYAYDNTKLSVRTSAIDSRVMVHNEGVWDAPAGQVIGTASSHPLSLVTGKATRLAITAAGQVGIGTTAPENAEGWTRVLDVYSGNYTKLSVRASSIDGRVMANVDGTFGAPAGQIIGTASNHPVSLVTNQATRLTITSDGQVGVGTTTPENSEQWHRVLDLSGGLSTKLAVRTATIDGRVMAHDSGIYDAPPGQIIGTYSNHPVSLVTSKGTRLTVLPSGNVGIGTTSPTEGLHLQGTFRAAANSSVAPGPALYVDPKGQVGVGTDAPENAESWYRVLDLIGPQNAKFSIRTGDGIDGRVLAHDGGMYGAPAGQIIGTASNHPVSLIANKAPRLTITSDGHAGVGTTVPENAEGWHRVLDLYGVVSTKLSVRTANVDSRVMAHDTGWFGAPAGQIIGTASNHPVSLVTNKASWVTLSTAGYLGIGTTTPDAPLTVIAGTPPNTGISAGIRVEAPAGMPGVGSQVWLDLIQPAPKTNVMPVYPAIRWTMTASGHAGYRLEGREDAMYLWVADQNSYNYGNLTAGTIKGSSFPIFSDARLKTDIVGLQDATSILEQVRGVRFAWTDEARQNLPADTPVQQIGVIAQEVAAVLPEVVHTDAAGLMSVDYSKLTVILIEAVKELSERLTAIETKG
ncbi:MAG TPA: tail fiber domain-containing protein [Trebonia sp.]|nr:tail fiber domain-containing protein [Trebonia sp.]